MFSFTLVCPTCGETYRRIKSDTRDNPRLNCGNCLADDAAVTELKVVSVTESKPTSKQLVEADQLISIVQNRLTELRINRDDVDQFIAIAKELKELVTNWLDKD